MPDEQKALLNNALIARAELLKVQSEDLDDLVHDLKSQEASEINNGGLAEQVAYLYNSLGITGAREEIDRVAKEQKEGGPS